jgi:hypothetical protein
MMLYFEYLFSLFYVMNIYTSKNYNNFTNQRANPMFEDRLFVEKLIQQLFLVWKMNKISKCMHLQSLSTV